MGPEQWRTPKGIALSNTATTPAAHTALTHALQHLRHALRCAGRAVPALGEDATAALLGGELCGDVAAAARSCANLIDHLEGYRVPDVGERRQGIDAAKQRHPAGTAL